MDWIVEALHQSHADEKRFREDAIIRLQEEQSKIQNRLDRLYDDRLDGFIEPDFFERKSREWRQTQKRLADTKHNLAKRKGRRSQFQRPSSYLAPHTGQSSQLFLDHHHRSAQFLPAVAKSALNLPVTASREHWRVSFNECSV